MTYPDLPTYRGLPVPYVARRQGEAPSDHDPAWGSFGFMYGVETLTGETFPVLVNENLVRDELGWLWQPAPTNMGGKPEFASVQSARHRECMDELLCQVCSQSAVTEAGSSWLVPEIACRNSSRPVIARQPPVCVACVPLSLEKCPHLRRDPWVHLYAWETRPWGVIGDVYDTNGNIIFGGEVNAQTHPQVAAMTLARQRLIELTDWSRA